MIQNYPRNKLSFSPSAVGLDFTAYKPLGDCCDLLSNAQIRPAGWRRMFATKRLEIRCAMISDDLWEFEAHEWEGRSEVIAKGYLQPLDATTTAINGYCDTRIIFYLWLAVTTIIGFIIAYSFLNGTRDSQTVFTALMIMYIGSAIFNIFWLRRRAKKLVQSIESMLDSNL